MARVSVGVPVYNGEEFLEAALDSLIGQTFDDLEIVVSDNASTDATPAIARRYAELDPRIRYVRNDRNRGFVFNFNQVFRLSSGEYFTWAAADDVRAPTYVERCVELLEADPGIVLAVPRPLPIDAHGEVTTGTLLPGPGRGVVGYTDYTNLDGPHSAGDPDPVDRFRRLMHDLWYTIQLYGVIRAEALARTGLHPPHRMGDHILLAELVLHGRFAEVEEPLFLRRLHDQQITRAETQLERVALARGDRDRAGRLDLVTTYLERLRLHAAGVERAPLTRAQKMRCHAVIASSTAAWARFRAVQLLGRGRG